MKKYNYFTSTELPVFISKDTYPFYERVEVQCLRFMGMSAVSKGRTALNLHQNLVNTYPKCKPLEISSASWVELGNKLSAMALSKRCLCAKDIQYTYYKGNKFPIPSVESVFQSSRVYSVDGDSCKVGPFTQHLLISGYDSKAQVKEEVKRFASSKGVNVDKVHSREYNFEENVFPAPEHIVSLFYNWVYMTALLEPENKVVMEELINGDYNAFTDTATKSLNSQARACAIFVGLYKAGLLGKISNVEEYFKLFRVNGLNADENRTEILSNGEFTGKCKVKMTVGNPEKVFDDYYALTGYGDKTLSNLKAFIVLKNTPECNTTTLNDTDVPKFLSKFEYHKEIRDNKHYIVLTKVLNSSHENIRIPTIINIDGEIYYTMISEDAYDSIFVNYYEHQINVRDLEQNLTDILKFKNA